MPKERSTDSLRSADLEQSFFRAWAKRPSEQEYSSDTPSSVGTPLSPKTVLPKRKLKRPANTREISESSQHSHGPQEVLTPDVKLEGFPFLKQTRQLDAGLFKHRRLSTTSERTQSLLKISKSRRCSSVAFESETPGKPKNGYIWKRKISGRWLEVRVGRQSRSEVLASGSEEGMSDFPDPSVALEAIKTIAKEIETKDFAPHSPTNIASRSALLDNVPKETLYNRTKRRLGLRSGSSEPDQDKHRTNTFTADILQRASTILRAFAEQKRTNPSLSASSSSQSIAVCRSRRPRLLPFRRSYGHSSSSSIRNLKMGLPPQASPDPESMYTGSDNKQYFRVEMSAPGAPTYLPSEARRILTPPLPSADRIHRSSFFDLNSAPYKSSADQISCVKKAQQKQQTSGVDYFRGIQAAWELNEYQNQFDLNIPEHLPSSPLCPKNPKHRSGGNGICVYHGRNHNVPLDDQTDERQI